MCVIFGVCLCCKTISLQQTNLCAKRKMLREKKHLDGKNTSNLSWKYYECS